MGVRWEREKGRWREKRREKGTEGKEEEGGRETN